MRPVWNEARPAVQLAWPYQLVNIAPSLARRSMFGVGWPRAAPPMYTPKSLQPTSSAISMTTLGFFSWACTLDAGSADAVASAASAAPAVRIDRHKLIETSSMVCCPRVEDAPKIFSRGRGEGASGRPDLRLPFAVSGRNKDTAKVASSALVARRADVL